MAFEKPPVVLLTGAAGKTGQAILEVLAKADCVTRAFVRDADQRQVVESLGAGEVVEGNLLDDDAVLRATRGASAIYHICPNVHPDEVSIGRRVIGAAGASGVGHFVFHSVLHPQVEAMPHHWAKMRVEEMIFESGLPFTILQPAPYMQNLFAQWARVDAEGVYAVPYSLSSRVAMVDLADVAEVAARVLLEPGHGGAVYELCAPDLLNQREIAELLGRHFGREARAERLDLTAWARAASCRPGSYRHDTLVKMFEYYAEHGMAGNPRVLESILGRKARDLLSFAALQGR